MTVAERERRKSGSSVRSESLRAHAVAVVSSPTCARARRRFRVRVCRATSLRDTHRAHLAYGVIGLSSFLARSPAAVLRVCLFRSLATQLRTHAGTACPLLRDLRKIERLVSRLRTRLTRSCSLGENIPIYSRNSAVLAPCRAIRSREVRREYRSSRARTLVMYDARMLVHWAHVRHDPHDRRAESHTCHRALASNAHSWAIATTNNYITSLTACRAHIRTRPRAASIATKARVVAMTLSFLL